MDMVKINLYKNGDLVLTKEGRKENDECIFENIVYNIKNNTLVREDASFRYLLDFNLNTATILLKEQNYTLPLKISLVNKELNSDCHKITYNIESENLISNVLEVIF